MSNIFTYEIDERNLRIQLKSLEVTMKPEAWQKFEVYSKANPYQQPKGSFRGFELNLSRNVVLPAVFGLIIILFSFLLFNFITIKNPPTSATSAVEPVTEETTAPIRAENKAVAEESGLKQEETIPDQSVPTEQTEVSNIVAVPPAASEISPAVPLLTPEQEAEQKLMQSKHKRRKNAEAEALSRIQPSIVEDVNEPAEMPN